MTLLLTEGFDWLETADLPAAYGAFTIFQPIGTITDTIEETGGRNGDKSLKITPGAGGPDLKNVVRTGTTEADSGNLGLGVSYLAKQTIQELDPDTVVAWTPSGVDAMEAGVKVE